MQLTCQSIPFPPSIFFALIFTFQNSKTPHFGGPLYLELVWKKSHVGNTDQSDVTSYATQCSLLEAKLKTQQQLSQIRLFADCLQMRLCLCKTNHNSFIIKISNRKKLSILVLRLIYSPSLFVMHIFTLIHTD